MKILHVEAGRFLYGGALQVRYLITGLHARGVENVLVVPPGSALERGLEAGLAKVYPVPMAGDLDLRLAFRLATIIRRERPDVVHLHSRRGADIMGGIAARWCGVPAVLSRRVDNRESPLQVRLKYPLYEKVIAISQGIREVLLEAGVSPARVVCVRSAVASSMPPGDCERDWFLQAFSLPRHARVIAAVAQLIPRKGHRFLIEALARLVDDYPGLYLLLLGQGPEEQVLREQLISLGLEGRVVFGGFRHDLPRLLPCFEIMVLPSLKEGLGVALLQASSAGIPVIASRAGGMPEAVRDGENGLLVPPGDSQALAAAIRRLLDDSSLADRLGEGGRALMAREFSVDVMVEGNLGIYRELARDR
ncbi:MAG: glycosyltransferase [Gammaproteobacteria bacterium]|nr:glycosyltransferase [Gammaproteobacteria bacterium]